MSTCLGLYIEKSLIKYAKVEKEHDNVKVEAFGTKFYDNLGEAIKQIIAETYSFKIPVSVNLSNEVYNYFTMFGMLNKKDMNKAIETEFESLCYEKGTNSKTFETRYTTTKSVEDKDNVRIVHAAVNRNDITMRVQQMEGNKIACMTTVPMALAGIANLKQNENIAIVNLEEKTTITTIVNQRIYTVDVLQTGMQDVLDRIASKENSYAKAFDVCKNTTIYTMDGQDLQVGDNNEYMEDIMPCLYNIVSKVQEIISLSVAKIDRIYIAGTGAVINNIDLYFQEFFKNTRCEFLKPYFIQDNVKINLKEYIEVDSAIALGLTGAGGGIPDINFKEQSLNDGLPEGLRTFLEDKLSLKITTGESWDNFGKVMTRFTAALAIFAILYCAASVALDRQIDLKKEQVRLAKADSDKQIERIQSDIENTKEKANTYATLIKNLEDSSNAQAENNRNKNMIPTFLTQLMGIIPKGVQITSVENTTDKHMVINAQSKKYEQLGYLKAKLREDGILVSDTVVSTAGTKDGDFVKIKIEGDLP